MRLTTTTTVLALLLCIQLASHTTVAQSRRLRIRTRPAPVAVAPQADDDSLEDDSELNDDYDTQPQQPVQYYTPEPARASVTPTSRYVSSNDDYNGLYGQPTAATPRQRIDYQRPSSSSSNVVPKTKENQTKAPPVQTIRNYNKVNDDGSFTFGYEAADGSFKEETRGTDCVVRGKYGYVDPDGNKREFTYVSGNPCDPSHPDETADEDRNTSVEDPNEPENVPQNYPRRPIKPIVRAQPAQQQQFATRAPIVTTTHAPPTTVFQNTYASNGYSGAEQDEDEQPETIQLLQPQRPQQQRAQYVQQRPQEEVTIRQRPRLTVANTTPSPLSAFLTPTRPVQPVSITPRPAYRLQQQSLQTQPPATTYRPSVQFVTQKSAAQLQRQQQQQHQQQINYSSKPTASPLSVEPLTKSSYVSSRKPIDFAVEFQKFQQEHNVLQPSTTPRVLQTQPTQRPFKPSQLHHIEQQAPTSNPIYESQLVFDPSTGQYDSNLFQQLPQSDGDFTLSNRHQPYVQLPQHPQPQFNQPPAHLVSLEQLQQQQPQQQPQHASLPIYNRQPLPLQTTRSPLQFQPQFSQQIYQKEHENNQVFSSQQLFAQQQELQQQQLQQDRLIAAAKRQPLAAIPAGHRFQQQQQQQQQQFQQQPQGFYYVQPPQQATGQIDAFLRGHNIDF